MSSTQISVSWMKSSNSRRGSWAFIELSPQRPPSRGSRSQVRHYPASLEILLFFIIHNAILIFISEFLCFVLQPKPCLSAKSCREAFLGTHRLIVLCFLYLIHIYNSHSIIQVLCCSNFLYVRLFFINFTGEHFVLKIWVYFFFFFLHDIFITM